MSQYTYTIENKKLTIVEEENAIVRITYKEVSIKSVNETPLIKMCYHQILEYLDGKRMDFSVPFRLLGTPFQIEVWQAIASIPYGETTSYRAVAERVNRPRAARAVGTACNRCPLDYIIPCQRVLASYGLGGYGKELDVKKKLLAMEAENVG